MARKETPIPQVMTAELDNSQLVNDVKAIDEMSIIESKYNNGRDLINQMIGRHSIVKAFENFSRTIGISDLARIKETKQYRDTKGMEIPNIGKLSGTWEEFCNVLGMSVDKVDSDIANLQAFGEEALEAMQNAGIGMRELRQYRKLPADEKTALIEAAKEGDKDTLLDLAESLIAKHAKEKQDLNNEVSELTQNYEAQGKVLADKSAIADKLATQLNAKEAAIKHTPPDEIAKQLRQQAINDGFEAEHAIEHKLGATFKALTEHSLDNGGEHKQFMLGLIVQIEHEILKVREAFNLHGTDITADETPDWMKADHDALAEQARNDMAAKQAELDAAASSGKAH